MAPDPERSLAPRPPSPGTALMRLRRDSADSFPAGLFCASPTVLQAINGVLAQRGMPTLYVHPDGTIGPADPLLLRMEYVPSPFVW